jgi:hypothetical protein
MGRRLRFSSADAAAIGRRREDAAALAVLGASQELLDELTECAILGFKVDVARYAAPTAVGASPFRTPSPPATVSEARSARRGCDGRA